MKRVLHVMNSLERSGMETMLLSSHAEWRRLGYACDVLATADSIGAVAPQMSECGYQVFHIPFRNAARSWPRLEFIREFYRLCASGYDVVHLHRESGRPVFAILAKLAGVKTIAVTPHGIFHFRGALHLRKLCERQLIRVLGGRFGMISEAVRMCEWSRFRIRGIRVRNWLDTERFRPPSPDERKAARQSLGIREQQFVIVSVGNCSEIKNHSALLQAVALLSTEIHPLYLHVGREQPESPERALAAELGIESRVRFFGTQADPRAFLWAADAFVMPSLHEGMPISAIEAIAAGAPLICSRVEGLTDVAAEARSAVLTATTPQSIAEALIQVSATKPADRQQRALIDSERVRERFSTQNGVRSIVEGLYA